MFLDFVLGEVKSHEVSGQRKDGCVIFYRVHVCSAKADLAGRKATAIVQVSNPSRFP